MYLWVPSITLSTLVTSRTCSGSLRKRLSLICYRQLQYFDCYLGFTTMRVPTTGCRIVVIIDVITWCANPFCWRSCHIGPLRQYLCLRMSTVQSALPSPCWYYKISTCTSVRLWANSTRTKYEYCPSFLKLYVTNNSQTVHIPCARIVQQSVYEVIPNTDPRISKNKCDSKVCTRTYGYVRTLADDWSRKNLTSSDLALKASTDFLREVRGAEGK